MGLRDRQKWACLAPALLLLPFAGKALHMDDPVFLHYARLVAAAPLHPFAQRFVYEGAQTTLFEQPNPLGWPLCIALWRAVAGESEIALHLLTAAFAVVALAAMAALARRLAVPPLLACLLLASSSAFLAMGTSIMPDVPFVALTLAAAACLVRAVDEGSAPAALAAGLLATGAFLCRYTGLAAVGLLLAYPVLARRWQPRSFLPFAAGVAGVLVCELLSVLSAGQPHFWWTLHHWSKPLAAQRAWNYGTLQLAQLGGQLPWPLLAPALLALRRSWWLAALAALLAAALALGHGDAARWLPVCLVFALPAVASLLDGLHRLIAGVAGLRRPLPDAREPLRLLCALWLCATLFSTIGYVHVAAKYALLPLPPALLLLLDGLAEARARFPRAARALVAAAVPATLGIGLLVNLSDYRWAGLYRDFFAGPWRAMQSHDGTNYVAGEWGFLHYAERAGLTVYRGQPLTPRDAVFVSREVYHPTAPDPARVRVTDVRELSYPGPFAINDRDADAGFYSQAWGVYPFALAASVTDQVLVLRGR